MFTDTIKRQQPNVMWLMVKEHNTSLVLPKGLNMSLTMLLDSIADSQEIQRTENIKLHSEYAISKVETVGNCKQNDSVCSTDML
jgi:hypothetical protein